MRRHYLVFFASLSISCVQNQSRLSSEAAEQPAATHMAKAPMIARALLSAQAKDCIAAWHQQATNDIVTIKKDIDNERTYLVVEGRKRTLNKTDEAIWLNIQVDLLMPDAQAGRHDQGVSITCHVSEKPFKFWDRVEEFGQNEREFAAVILNPQLNNCHVARQSQVSDVDYPESVVKTVTSASEVSYAVTGTSRSGNKVVMMIKAVTSATSPQPQTTYSCQF